MLDLKFIRDNKELFQQAAKNKNLNFDVQEFLAINDKRRQSQSEIDDLRAQKNKLAQAGQTGKPSKEQIRQGRELKEKISVLEAEFTELEKKYIELMWQVPQLPSDKAPIGKDAGGNKEIKKWGKIKKFAFPAKNHLELGRELDILDTERGVKVSGYRGYYLKNESALLHLALMMFTLDKMIKKGYQPFIPPTIVREFVMYGSGHFPFGRDDIYQITNPGKLADGSDIMENKYLVGTSEPSILAYHSDEILEGSELPKKYCGFSQCYRNEIGSYGKDTKGIYRIHEFMKIEQVIFCKNDYDESEKLHQEITAISEEILQDLKIPYRVLEICTGDMGAGKYRMYDLESWMPSRNSYGETHSSSNLGDWQARRLNIKYRAKDGKKEYIHTLNNTAIASPRILIAVLENYQQKDGSIIVPKVLRQYLPGKIKIIKKKK